MKKCTFHPIFVSLFGARCLCQNLCFALFVDRCRPCAGRDRLGTKIPREKSTVAKGWPARCNRHQVDWSMSQPPFVMVTPQSAITRGAWPTGKRSPPSWRSLFGGPPRRGGPRVRVVAGIQNPKIQNFKFKFSNLNTSFHYT